MKIWLVAVVLLAATSVGAAPKKAAKEAATKPTVDPNTRWPRSTRQGLGDELIPSPRAGEELAKWLPSSRERGTHLKNNEDRWRSTFWPLFKSRRPKVR